MKLPRTAPPRCIQRRSSALLRAERLASGQPRAPVQVRVRRVALCRARRSDTLPLHRMLPAAVFTTKLAIPDEIKGGPSRPPFYCSAAVPPAPMAGYRDYLRKLTDVMIFSHTACNSGDGL